MGIKGFLKGHVVILSPGVYTTREIKYYFILVKIIKEKDSTDDLGDLENFFLKSNCVN